MTNSSKEKTPSRKTSGKKSKSQSNAIKTLEDAFVHELSDMKNAEMQLTRALPKMAKAAADRELAKAFEKHLKETEQQIELIEQAVKSCKIKLKREKCDAMEGLIKEGKDIIKNVEEGAVRDVMLIAAAQKVEHYEIASYGCLVAAANQLGFSEAAEFLEEILDQEKRTDEKLNQLAEGGINEEAGQQGQSSGRGKTAMGRGRGRGRSSSSYDYDDDRYSSGGRGGYNGDRSYAGGGSMSRRDDEGRFMSDDDYGYRQGRGSRSDRYYSSQDYNDRGNNRSSRSSGQDRGWFGDPQGHARAGRSSHDNDRSRSAGRR